jgi:hypothetical protein
VTIRIEEASGITGFVPNEALAPLGNPVIAKVTGVFKPFSPVTCVVYVIV